MLVWMDRQNKAETQVVKFSQSADACAFAAVHVGPCKVGSIQVHHTEQGRHTVSLTWGLPWYNLGQITCTQKGFL